MNEFYSWLKNYIQEAFENDADIAKTVTIENAYKQGNEITTSNVPQIQVQIMDNAESQRYSSFYEGENATYMPMQISSYTGQMKINNVMKSAQEASIIFGEKIKNLLHARTIQEANGNIMRCRITTMSPALPLLDGSKVYVTTVRVEFWVAYPYVSE